MKIRFDEATWSELGEYLRVGRVCGATANDLNTDVKGVAQRVVASLGTERDVSEAEAEHALSILLTLRDSTVVAARCYARVVERIDALIAGLEPAASDAARRTRRRRSRSPKL